MPNVHLLNKRVVGIIVVIVLCSLAYAYTLNSPFHFDDDFYIIDNPIIKNLRFFIEPSTAERFKSNYGYHTFKMRYIASLTFALNYKLHGLGVTGYHIFNLAIHILNAILVYWLVALTLTIHDTRFTIHDKGNTPLVPPVLRGELKGGIVHHASWIVHHHLVALFSALLFVAHPVQTQAVTYVTQRFTSLAAFFCLLSLVMYIKFRIHDTKKIHDAGYTIHDKENHTACIMDRGSCIVSRASCIMYLAALFSAVLAMKTKETAFTLPVVITLYEFMFFTDSRFTVHGSRTKRRILYLIPLLLTMLIIPFSRIDIDQPSGNLISDVDEATRALTATSRWDYLITEFRVLVTYLRLLLLPINQNLDYDYPIYHSFLNPEVLLSFLFLLSIFGFGVYLLYRSRVTMHDARYMIHDEQSTMHASRITHHALRFIAFGIFWFFITLSVESSIIPTRDAIFEHRLYLPSIGFIIAFSSLLFYVSQQSGSATVQQNDSAAVNSTYSPVQIFSGSRVTRHALRVTCFAVVVLLSIAAYQRNIVWQDKITLWEDVARKSPDKARGHGNLGKAYLDKGILDKALEHLRLSLRLNPTNARAHNNIGVAYGLQGLSDKAGEHYRLASEIDPEYSESHFNLGVIYLGKEDMDNARREFETALRLNPDHYQAKKFLGYIYQTHR